MSSLTMGWVRCVCVAMSMATVGCGSGDKAVEDPGEAAAPEWTQPPAEQEPAPPPATGPGAVVASIARADGSPYWPVAPSAVLLPPGCTDITCAVQLVAQPATGRLVAEAEAATYTVALYWQRGGGMSPALQTVLRHDVPLSVDVRPQTVTDLGTITFDLPKDIAATVRGRALKLHSHEPLAGFDIRIGIMVCEEPREQVITGTATSCSPFMNSNDILVRTDAEGNFEFPNMTQWSYYLYHGQYVPAFTGVYGTKENGDGLVIPTNHQPLVDADNVYFDHP